MKKRSGDKRKKKSGRTQRKVQDESLPDSEGTVCCLMETRAKRTRVKRRPVSGVRTGHCVRRALRIRRRLDSGVYTSDADYARKHSMTPARVCQLLSLLDRLHPDVIEFLAELPSLRKSRVTERYLRGEQEAQEGQEAQKGLACIPKDKQLTELKKDIAERMCSRRLRRKESMRFARREFMQSLRAGTLDI